MDIQNLVIIGSGPAGYSAAIYAARANLAPIVFEGFLKGLLGGQLMTTTDVENFPGFPEGILGPVLMENMRKQAIKFGSICLAEDVNEVDFSKRPFKIIGSKSTFLTHAVILATGAEAKKLNIKGSNEGEFWQRGVTACAICDGAAPIFRSKDLFVIGGGDSAVEEAVFLTKYAKKVFIVHRRDVLKASKIMAERAFKNSKIEILWNSEVIEILGTDFVEEVLIKNNKTNTIESRKAGGVFFAIGHSPNTEFLKNRLQLKNGYIVVEKGTSKTHIKGVFAAGDVQDPIYRQAITAAGSGCMAALDAEKYLSEMGYTI
ncbi:MAG: thioredoxin-disulfide reductase [Chlamydiae bacterium RIFCSPHIGHO2_12_FULL_27_8]|nr:MAG: thioredoxin-disulfide reductase [Chlamydiae bacterium RIFCSPHIGHO2_12_FULL_27_8]